MCGIIGYIGEESAAPMILDGLQKLEYRGYDSAGLSVYSEEGLHTVKKQGRLNKLAEELKKNPVVGTIGIGHTRWATHGEPSDKNAHPHLGNKGEIAVVHNGIIENYKELRQKMEEKGIVFVSETDSEVVAQMLEYYDNGDILDTVFQVTSQLEGSYALGVLSVHQPDRLIAIKKDSPLIIGLSEKGQFIASDIPAILKHTTQVCYLDEGEVAVLEGDRVTFYNEKQEPIDKKVETISWTIDSAEKGGYPHFMLKEMEEQPKVIKETIHSFTSGDTNRKVLDEIPVDRYNRIVVTACGSASHVGFVAKNVIEHIARISVEVDLASEFRYRDGVIDGKTLVILISQSGETADTIAALREAKKKGASTLAIVNVVGSTIAKEADYTLYTLAGPEIAVATTKALSTQLIAVYFVALGFAKQRGTLTPEREAELVEQIKQLPAHAEKLIKNKEKIKEYSTLYSDRESVFFIGRNVDYPVVMEGSLKLKEISYIHSEAFAGGELKHGTISLIKEDTLVVAVSNCKNLYDKLNSNVEQVITRGATVLLVTNEEGVKESDKMKVLSIPKTDDMLTPSLSVLVLQLFAYYVALERGCDIDKPRNLAKSVTVE